MTTNKLINPLITVTTAALLAELLIRVKNTDTLDHLSPPAVLCLKNLTKEFNDHFEPFETPRPSTQHPDIERTMRAAARFGNNDTSSPAYRQTQYQKQRGEIEYRSWLK